MFDFDVNNYLNGIKIKVFGVEYDDTLPLQLKRNQFENNAIHKYNVYDYYVDTSGIYVIYKEPCYNMFSKDEETTSIYFNIKKFNYYMDNYEELILPDNVNLDDVVIPFETSFNQHKFKLYTDVLKYLMLNKDKKKTHGEIEKYTLPLTVIQPNMTDIFNVYEMKVSDEPDAFFKGITIAIKFGGRKLEQKYALNSPTRFKLFDKEYPCTSSGLKILYDAFFLEQRFTLV